MESLEEIKNIKKQKEVRKRDLLKKIKIYNDQKTINEREIISLQNENNLLEKLVLESQRHYGALSENDNEEG